MINIDGSYNEGGGQIVRTALAFSTLLGKDIQIKKIRKGRKKPGLKHQHLNALDALKQLCNAEVTGGKLGSTELVYKPGKLKYTNLNIDIKTAGSITLVLQALLPVILFSDKKIKVKLIGGTDTSFSQPIDYFTNVFILNFMPYAEISTSIEKRGYYPKGGGVFYIDIKPKYRLNSFQNFDEFLKNIRETPIELVDNYNLVIIRGVSHASKDLMKAQVSERTAKRAKYLLNNLSVPVKIHVQYTDTLSTGSGITLWAIYSNESEYVTKKYVLGSDSLGKKGVKSEKIGEDAVKRLLKQVSSEACVDRYLADQLIPYLALFGGKIKVSEITDHVLSNIYVTEKFFSKKFKVDKKKKIIEYKI